jgi:hypothetical protein
MSRPRSVQERIDAVLKDFDPLEALNDPAVTKVWEELEESELGGDFSWETRGRPKKLPQQSQTQGEQGVDRTTQALQIAESKVAEGIRAMEIKTEGDLARAVSKAIPSALASIVSIAEDANAPRGARLRASMYLLDRFAGRPTQAMEITHQGDAPGTIKVVQAILPAGIEGIISSQTQQQRTRAAVTLTEMLGAGQSTARGGEDDGD